MQPNPQQPPPPQYGQPPAHGPAPVGGGPGPGAAPPRPPRPRSATAAAVTAGVLALLTSALLVAFAIVNVAYAVGPVDRAGPLGVNAASGLVSGGALALAALFTFFRWIPAAWTLCGLSALYALASVFASPLAFGTSQVDQLAFLFGFREIDDALAGLAVVFAALTAISAAIAGSVRATGPATAGR